MRWKNMYTIKILKEIFAILFLQLRKKKYFWFKPFLKRFVCNNITADNN